MKVISCYEAVSRMFEFFDGIISKEQKNELDSHVQVCRECCNRFEFEELFKEKLTAVAAQEKSTKELAQRIKKIFGTNHSETRL